MHLENMLCGFVLIPRLISWLTSRDFLKFPCFITDDFNLSIFFPFIFHIILYSSSSNDSSTTLAASRTLTLWTTVALTTIAGELESSSDVKGALIGTASIPQRLLEYVWTNWDHPVDVSQDFHICSGIWCHAEGHTHG